MSHFQALMCTNFGHWGDLEMQRVTRQPLQPGQVRIQVHHAGVGFAVSLFVSGRYQRKLPLPFTPGTEVSGVILETAPDVAQLYPGQRVIAALDWGGFAEEAVASASTVYPVPGVLELPAATALPVTYGTAWAALEWRAKLRAGESLLVHGAGGSLGRAAVQIGRLMGARVIATASTNEKCAAALRNGAHYALSSVPDDLVRGVKDLCPSGGVDVVFDPVGGAVFDASLRCLAPEGRLLSLGFASGHIPTAAANLLLVKNISIIGFNYGYYIGWGLIDERATYQTRVKDVISKLLTAFADGAMPLPKTQHFRFAQWKDALDTVMARRSVGKVMLDVCGSTGH